MKNTLASIVPVLFLIAFGCSHSQKTAKKETTLTPLEKNHSYRVEGTITPPADTTTKSVLKADEYRLVVSFISRGEGTDGDAIVKFDTYIRNLVKKVGFEKHNWGREGEVEYCIKLNELTPGEQKDFIDKTHEMLKECKLVNIYENAPCVNKKQ